MLPLSRRMKMITDSPEHAVELLDRAFNEGDLDAVLGFYEEAAVVTTEPGKLARGSEELKNFFEQVMGSGNSAKQLKTHVIEADGVALFLSRWTLHTANANSEARSQTFVATTVFRKKPNGTWKILIDNSFGPLVLGPE
jgi:ketosteroid isomerase-like protein